MYDNLYNVQIFVNASQVEAINAAYACGWRRRFRPPFSSHENAGRCRNQNPRGGSCLQFASRLAA
jgi:hypothetical protein